jgi:hypothetical protein
VDTSFTSPCAGQSGSGLGIFMCIMFLGVNVPTHGIGPDSSPCEPENGPFFESTTRFSKYSGKWLDSTHARRDDAESRVVCSASICHSIMNIRGLDALGVATSAHKNDLFFRQSIKRGDHFDSSSPGEGEWVDQWWLKTILFRAPPRPTRLLGHQSPPLGCHTKKPP